MREGREGRKRGLGEARKREGEVEKGKIVIGQDREGAKGEKRKGDGGGSGRGRKLVRTTLRQGGLGEVGRRVLEGGEGGKKSGNREGSKLSRALSQEELTNNLPTIYQQFTNNLPIIYQQFTNNLPTIIDPLKPKCWCTDTVISRAGLNILKKFQRF